MPTPLTSPTNPHLKALLRLEKRSERRATGRTVVEGQREVSRCLAAGVVPVEAYVCHELVTAAESRQALHRLAQLDHARQCHLFEVTPELFQKLAVREESGGIVLVIPTRARTVADFRPTTAPLLCMVENAEKPGNLGAILRTADAAGVDGLLVCGGTDLWNPNVVRASLGTLFTVPAVEMESADAIRWLKDTGIRIVATTPDATVRYTGVDLTGPVAIAMGSEAHGLTPAWLAAADERVVIPMVGAADSLNLATATALLLYEAVRQRM
jgi:RNA methyltransferase, TrmH family